MIKYLILHFNVVVSRYKAVTIYSSQPTTHVYAAHMKLQRAASQLSLAETLETDRTDSLALYRLNKYDLTCIRLFDRGI